MDHSSTHSFLWGQHNITGRGFLWAIIGSTSIHFMCFQFTELLLHLFLSWSTELATQCWRSSDAVCYQLTALITSFIFDKTKELLL